MSVFSLTVRMCTSARTADVVIRALVETMDCLVHLYSSSGCLCGIVLIFDVFIRCWGAFYSLFYQRDFSNESVYFRSDLVKSIDMLGIYR